MDQVLNNKKDIAIQLRLQGKSYRQISSSLNVAKSTISGWLKNIEISTEHKATLRLQWIEGLKKARSMAGKTNHLAKLRRIDESEVEAKKFLKSLSLDNSELELFLSGLYLGEGFKIKNRFGLGNANPDVVLLYITLLRILYPINESRLRAAIFGRSDQDKGKLIQFWSNLLKIPPTQFHKTQLDTRTKNTVTTSDYHGVCAVSYNDSQLQRRILAISSEVVKYVNKPNKGVCSSIG